MWFFQSPNETYESKIGTILNSFSVFLFYECSLNFENLKKGLNKVRNVLTRKFHDNWLGFPPLCQSMLLCLSGWKICIFYPWNRKKYHKNCVNENLSFEKIAKFNVHHKSCVYLWIKKHKFYNVNKQKILIRKNLIKLDENNAPRAFTKVGHTTYHAFRSLGTDR